MSDIFLTEINLLNPNYEKKKKKKISKELQQMQLIKSRLQ